MGSDGLYQGSAQVKKAATKRRRNFAIVLGLATFLWLVQILTGHGAGTPNGGIVATAVPPSTRTGYITGTPISYSFTARLAGSDSAGWEAIVRATFTNAGSSAETVYCEFVYTMGSNTSWPDSIGGPGQWVPAGQTRTFTDQGVGLLPRSVVGGKQYPPGLTILDCNP